jgi:hypothetical protein
VSTPRKYDPPNRPIFSGQPNISQERWDNIFKKELRDGRKEGREKHNQDNMVQKDE